MMQVWKKSSVETALIDFVKTETLSSSDRFKCSTCHARPAAEAEISLCPDLNGVVVRSFFLSSLSPVFVDCFLILNQSLVVCSGVFLFVFLALDLGVVSRHASGVGNFVETRGIGL